MTARSAVGVSLALLLCVDTTACSFAFTKGPPANHRQLNYIPCATAHGAPNGDVFMAIVTSPFVAPAIAYGASAVVGYRRVRACRRARGELLSAYDAARLRDQKQ